MKRDIRPFNGGFKKDIHYTCYGGLKKANFDVRFDKALFKAVSAEIEQRLGKKSRYNVDDAVLYFRIKYQAIRIPWDYAAWYEECDNDILFCCYAEPSKDTLLPFDYSRESGERNITLVIDTAFNSRLRAKYPDIEELEQERMMDIERVKGKENIKKIPRCNPIIAIGYNEDKTINSMLRYTNFWLTSDAENPRPIITDIDYEMWYFYKHS